MLCFVAAASCPGRLPAAAALNPALPLLTRAQAAHTASRTCTGHTTYLSCCSCENPKSGLHAAPETVCCYLKQWARDAYVILAAGAFAVYDSPNFTP